MANTGLMDHLNHPQLRPQDDQFSMAKDTDESTVWSDGPRNKYDPAPHAIISFPISRYE